MDNPITPQQLSADLVGMLQDLVHYRASETRAKAEIEKILDDPDLHGWNEEKKHSQEMVRALDTQIRDLSAFLFPTTSGKTEIPGISIVQSDDTQITVDWPAAFDWIMADPERIGAFLMIEEDKLIKHAFAVEKTTPLPFVTIIPRLKAKAQISRDLAIYEHAFTMRIEPAETITVDLAPLEVDEL